MGFKTHKQMGEALLRVKVPTMERVVLLDMALAVEDGSLVYSWGHDRLALAIGKEPGTPAAKQALSGRILPRLIERGLIRKASEAHRGHRAEYVLALLSDRGMGNGSEGERVTVSRGMGNAQTVTPLPTPLPREQESMSRLAHDEATMKPSQAQIEFRFALAILSGDGIPSDEQVAHWVRMPRHSLAAEIERLVKDLPRASDYLGPHFLDPEYDALPPRYRRWADAFCVPTDVTPEETWPTRIPGQPDAWTDHREESA